MLTLKGWKKKKRYIIISVNWCERFLEAMQTEAKLD